MSRVLVAVICCAASSSLVFASQALALDDLGVVSGDTFELPGYNDGPSGGGVWPGSSGKGGDVGAMPLPNGVPAGGDIGGGPGSGPTGGDGPGTDGGPTVDQSRPPYQAPKDRNTANARLPFDLTDGFCSSSTSGNPKSAAVLGARIQTVGEGESGSPGTVLQALENAVYSDVHKARDAIRDLVNLVRQSNYAESHGAAATERQQLAVELGQATFRASQSLKAVINRVVAFLQRRFSARNRAELCSEDKASRLQSARMGLTLSEFGTSLISTMGLVPDIAHHLGSLPIPGDPAGAFRHDVAEAMEAALRFGFSFTHTMFDGWANYYRDEVRQLSRASSPGKGN